MIHKLTSEFIISIKIFILMVIITGVLYAGIVTFLGNLLFPEQVQGSLIIKDQKIIGSKLIAQKFSSARYFGARPSASDYNAVPSSGSNLGPTSKDLKSISSSASGLDPDISPESAFNQVPRIAQTRSLSPKQTEKLKELITEHIQERDFGFLGEPRVNVLELNLALDETSL